ncbi:winged helix-turn-helix domain-containing protein [Salinispora cortesiana]|uniref:winged helix-turn-helix domain-containing protein n=1 Tax=Salinispora cortesiana TaxID=1305843 RepID=UPI00041F8387|nr:winged helix-turn-helix domain-containing protein [Salinispora cortesiana]
MTSRSIKAGILKPGDKLPSTRELADQYETSPATVCKSIDIFIESGELLGRQGMGVFVAIPPAALRILRERGLVEGRQGKGTYVSEVQSWGSASGSTWDVAMPMYLS